MADYSVLDFGAVGNGSHNDATAIQRAIETCSQDGGGRVVLPSGRVYYSGSIELKSNVNLHVDIGACLKASSSLQDYAIPNGSCDVEASPHRESQRAFIYATHQKSIVISGDGLIDGNSEAFAGATTPYHISGVMYPRPALVYLEKCSRITLRDITLQNSPFWTIHPAACEDVSISGIRILNQLNMANCDGIDPDHCRNVRIVNCHIESADDCIVFKNTRGLKNYGPTENVVVSGCTLVSTSAAIKIGTESASDFRNILVENCVISKSNRGLSIQLRDEGNVENVHFSNIVVETRRFSDEWWGRAEPIYVTTRSRDGTQLAGAIRNVRFTGISCNGESGVFVQGTPDEPIEDVVFENVQVRIRKWTKWGGGEYDLRPCAGDPLLKEDVAGIYCRHAKNVTLRHVDVTWADPLPHYYGSALNAFQVQDLVLDDFRGTAAHPGKPDIVNQP